MADIEAINDLKDDAKLEAIADRAAMIASQLNSATDAASIRALGDAAKLLMASIPQGYANTGSVTSRVESVISAAAQKEAEADGDESSVSYASGSVGPRSRMSMEFQKAIYNQFMSSEERAYYDQFQPGTQYRMATIDENGNITEKMVDGKQATVDGAQLREDFTRVKAYTLTEEQQSNITLPGGEKITAMPPAEEKKELDKLEKSLDNLEGQKAQELADTGASQEDAKRVRGAFMKARERVRDLKEGLDDLDKAKRNGRRSEEEQATDKVKLSRRRLSTTLKDDVIDDALTEKKRGGRKGREKDDDLENEMVTPANTRAGGVRARDADSKKEADRQVIAATGADKDDDKQVAAISGMRDVGERDLSSLAPAGTANTSSKDRGIG